MRVRNFSPLPAQFFIHEYSKETRVWNPFIVAFKGASKINQSILFHVLLNISLNSH